MLAAWIVFPLVLAALCLGWGWVLVLVARTRFAPVLLPGAGMAAIVVVGQALTHTDATAELATPVIAAGAATGLGLGLARGWGRPPRWAVAAAAAVFAVYAAPIVLSGEPTLAGFIKLDDTATWLAITDRIMEHGRSLDGLAPSTYEATLDFNLAEGYPIGVFPALGVGAALVGQDVAWVFQPYLAVWAVVLALALWELAGRVVESPAWRAGIAFVGAQPALLYGYFLWGGVKEIAAIALLATTAALLPQAVAPGGVNRVIPVAVVSAALVGVLSGGGGIWLVPLALAGVAACALARGSRVAAARAGFAAAIVALGSVPLLLAGGLTPPTSAPLTDRDALGNLGSPLSLGQIAGIWPAGDFRADPDVPFITGALIGIACVGAVVGLAAAWRRRAWPALVFVAGVLAAATAIAIIGSPWVGGKALATASVAIPFAALLGAGTLARSGSTLLAAGLGGLVAAGVLWSNVLAYGEVNLAPRDQLVELERIGELAAGEGPTLMTEYSPFGARHFLREGDPEAISELRRREIPLASGEPVPKGGAADTDELDAEALLVYRSLVLRRSPVRSRPPSPYRLEWAGESYELWQRPPGPPPRLERLALGSELDPAAFPRCDDIRRIVGGTSPKARLLAARAARPRAAGLGEDLTGTLRAPAGAYAAWLRGSVRGEATLRIDGEMAGTVRHVLNNEGGWIRFGEVALGGGPATVELELGGRDLRPGSGGPPFPVGPVALVPPRPARKPITVPATRAERLCGERLDWVEAVTP